MASQMYPTNATDVIFKGVTLHERRSRQIGSYMPPMKWHFVVITCDSLFLVTHTSSLHLMVAMEC